ncbi:PTS transporter subunit EIIC [Spirochaetales bacterium BR151]|uniref:PTS transporter subunit EIIC n=1 Tax=Entomospira culicis TaxID=2719989 RepID=A0A968GGF3_9SPIO|nr:PTS transporter subunit EIIC [Entomospira culicis]NIZ69361.1 PTS transporter subunit EIIC [Entomospira culicis]
MFEKVQKFGAAMFVSVMLFLFVGILLAVIQSIGFTIKQLGLESSMAWLLQFLGILESGAWAVFIHMSILFAMGIPISMAQKAPARAVLATFITYLTFNYFVGAILTTWPGIAPAVDFTQNVGGTSGLTMVAGIKTLDMSIIGGVMVGFIMTAIHNKFYDKKLPDYLGIFQGVALVAMIGFFVMLPLAFAVVLVWPVVQSGIAGLQGFLMGAGNLGVWLYTFLEKILLPFGLHHFIYGPFIYGPAAVDGGIKAYWIQHMTEFANNPLPLKEQFTVGFSLHGNGKVFGLPAAALAMYHTAKPENRKAMAGLLIPAALTAFLTGITEPIEFTFLFIAPMLFVVHAFLSATAAMTMYMVGVVGDMGGGALDMLSTFWWPMLMSDYHKGIVFTHIGVGLVFTVIYYFVFRFMILRFDLPTPGRGESETKLYKKADYKEKQAVGGQTQAVAHELADGKGSFAQQARGYMEVLGGKENIETVTNCMTRLRVKVRDASKAEQSVDAFKAVGATSVVIKGESYQVIIGMDVQNVRDEFDKLMQ